MNIGFIFVVLLTKFFITIKYRWEICNILEINATIAIWLKFSSFIFVIIAIPT